MQFFKHDFESFKSPPVPYSSSFSPTYDCELPSKYRHFCRQEPDLFRLPETFLIPGQQKQRLPELAPSKFSLAVSWVVSWFKPTGLQNEATDFDTALSRSSTNNSSATFYSTTSEISLLTVVEEPKQECKGRASNGEPPRKTRKTLNYHVAMKIYSMARDHQKASEKSLGSPSVLESEQLLQTPLSGSESPELQGAEETALDLVRFHTPRKEEKVSVFEDFFDDGYRPALYPIIEVSEESESESDWEESEDETEENVPEYLAKIWELQRLYYPWKYELNLLSVLAQQLQKPEVYEKAPTKIRFSEDDSETELNYSFSFDKHAPPSEVRPCPGNFSFHLQPLLKKPKKDTPKAPVPQENGTQNLTFAEVEEEIDQLLEAVDFNYKCLDENDYDIEICLLIDRLGDLFLRAGATVNEPVSRWFTEINASFYALRVEVDENTKLVNAMISVLEHNLAEHRAYRLDAKQLQRLIAKHFDIKNRVKKLRESSVVEDFVDRHSHAVEIKHRLEALLRGFHRAHKELLGLENEEQTVFLLRQNEYDETALLQRQMTEEDVLVAFQEYCDELECYLLYFGELLLLFMEAYEQATRGQLEK